MTGASGRMSQWQGDVEVGVRAWTGEPPPDPVADGPDADSESVARTILLDALTGQARSRQELRQKLAKKDVPDDLAERLLDRFTEVGLVDDEAFALLEQTITEVFPDAVPTPYVMMAATDSRFFTEICDRVYRFAPFRMTKRQRESVHSYDEHLAVADLADGVTWFQRLIERLP